MASPTCCAPPGDIEVVGESGSAQEATRRIPALKPDVAVLDARLSDGNGIDVCRDVRAVGGHPAGAGTHPQRRGAAG